MDDGDSAMNMPNAKGATDRIFYSNSHLKLESSGSFLLSITINKLVSSRLIC